MTKPPLTMRPQRLAVILSVMAMVGIQVGEGTADFRQQNPRSNAVQAEVTALLEEERREPTTADIADKRFQQMVHLFQQLIGSGQGHVVSQLLSREQTDALERQLRQGERESVATSLRNLFSRLANVEISSQPGQGRNREMSQGPRRDRYETGRREMAAGPRSSRMDSFRDEGPLLHKGRDSDDPPTPSSLASLVPLATYDIHHLLSQQSFGSILKLTRSALDSSHDRLYVMGSITTQLGVVDTVKNQLIKTSDLGISGGFLVYSDGLYSFNLMQRQLTKIDLENNQVEEMSSDMVDRIIPKQRNAPLSWKSYEFQMQGYSHFSDGTTGFPPQWRQDLNGAYGVIEITEKRTGDKKGEILAGIDSLYFTIDEKQNKLFTVNTGDASINIFDMNRLEETNFCADNSCLIGTIDVGTSVDQILSDKKGRIYIRNRLGGSQIIRYDPLRNDLMVIDNENAVADGIPIWPTGMALDENEQFLYVLGHYAARVSIHESENGRKVDEIVFPVTTLPRTDSISTMAMSPRHHRLYAALPELGQIWVADTRTRQPIHTIDLGTHGFPSQATNRGPGMINLAVDDDTGRLFVYLYEPGKLLVFSQDGEKLLNETSVRLSRKMENVLSYHPGKDEIHLSNRVLDGQSLQARSTLKGYQVIGVDQKQDLILVADESKDQDGIRQSVILYRHGRVEEQWNLGRSVQVLPRYLWDSARNRLYVGNFETGVVQVYELPLSSR